MILNAENTDLFKVSYLNTQFVEIIIYVSFHIKMLPIKINQYVNVFVDLQILMFVNRVYHMPQIFYQQM